MVVSILMVVVLPAPLGPKKPKIAPAGTEKEMPSTARKSPKLFVSPSTSMMGVICTK